MRNVMPPSQSSTPASGLPTAFPRFGLAIAACAVLAAVLRLAAPGHFPPGLNQDEAINAWNAWCLLHTGHDMTGAHWPVFYSHAIGDQRTTLFFYLLLPIQAIFGLSAWSTRLPSALLGIACVPLVAMVARRAFGDRVAVIAALLIAVDPWNVWLGRWGIEGGVTPFLGLLPLALLAKARLLPPREGEAPSIGWALAAGLAAGAGCYGYWSVRVWMPATLLLLVLSCGPRAWARLREAAFRNAVLAALAAFALKFGPLAWRHATDPLIGHRAEMTRLWAPGASLFEIARLMLARWAIHFGPACLFVRGDTYDLLQPPVGGALFAFMAPLLVLGLAFALTAWRSAPARMLLALVVAYPLGDVFASYDGVHALRSAVGAPALILLAAYGAERAWTWCGRFGAATGRAASWVFLVVVALSGAITYRVAFGEYDARPAIWHGFQSDLLRASEWLRTNAKAGEPIVCTVTGFNEPWSVMLVGMKLDPARWFAGPLERKSINGWDVYGRVGDWWFLYDPADVQRRALSPQLGARPHKVWLVVRPGEVHQAPALVIRDPQGRESLWICAVAI